MHKNHSALFQRFAKCLHPYFCNFYACRSTYFTSDFQPFPLLFSALFSSAFCCICFRFPLHMFTYLLNFFLLSVALSAALAPYFTDFSSAFTALAFASRRAYFRIFLHLLPLFDLRHIQICQIPLRAFLRSAAFRRSIPPSHLKKYPLPPQK